MGQRVFGASQFSRMLTIGDCPGHYGLRETLTDSPGRTEIPCRTALDRFYKKWPNWTELKRELGLETGDLPKIIYTD